MCFVNKRVGRPKAERALFVMPSASGGCLASKSGKLVRVHSLTVVDGNAKLANMALAAGAHGSVPVEDATNRGKMTKAYFIANLNQKSNYVLFTYDDMGSVITLEPALDEDGCPLLLVSRLRGYSEKEHAQKPTAENRRADLRTLNAAAPSTVKYLLGSAECSYPKH